MNTSVFVRFVYESPYINSFIAHYKNIGFSNIIILFHDTFLLDDKYSSIIDKQTINLDNSKLIKEQLISNSCLDSKYLDDDSIIIHPVNNYKNKMYGKFRKILPSSINWLLVVDSDEFLIINNKYKNITELINDAVKNLNDIKCIQFKWVWITNAFKSKEETLNNIILNHECFENKKIGDIRFNIKTMYKYNPNIHFGNHFSHNNRLYPKYTITTYLKNDNDFIKNKNTLKHSSINENTLGFLIHVRIRSFHNLIFKTFNNYGISSKNKARKEGLFFDYFTNKKHKKIDPYRCLKLLYNFKVFEYEKRHINNIKSLKILYTIHFNNCLSYDTLFTIKTNEHDYYKKWVKNNFSKLKKKKFDRFNHNISFYNTMFESVNDIENTPLIFLVK